MYLFQKKSYLSVLTSALLVFFAASLHANSGDFSDEELEGFANAVTQVMNIQQQGQMQMIEQIEGHDMTVERFNAMYMQMQQAGIDEVEGTDEEKESFVKVTEEIESIQMELETVIVSTIEEEGLSIEKYEEIMMAYQQDPELQQRIQMLMAQ